VKGAVHFAGGADGMTLIKQPAMMLTRLSRVFRRPTKTVSFSIKYA
jgi:hypothetical protein